MGVSSGIRWIARAKIGELAPRPQGRRRTSSLDAHEAFIVGLIEERKDITLNEMVGRLVAEQSVGISRSALCAWLCRHGWTFKKSPRTHWSRTPLEDQTFTGALRLTGMTAPFVYDGAMNGNVFLAYVEQALVPTLSEGDVVVMDMCGRPRQRKMRVSVIPGFRVTPMRPFPSLVCVNASVRIPPELDSRAPNVAVAGCRRYR